MIIEGKNAVREALKAGATIDKLCVLKGADKLCEALAMQAKAGGAKVLFCTRENMDRLSINGKHQGILAYTTEFEYTDLEEIMSIKPQGKRLIIILDGVEDPHNFGSIIRSAECNGACGIVIGKHRAVSVSETVIKTSVGASQYVKIARVTNVNDVMRELKDQFFKIYAMDMVGDTISGADLSGDVVLVVGGEGKGVKTLTKNLCDKTVSIPMFGEISSMNVAVAAGIGMYEYNRQNIK